MTYQVNIIHPKAAVLLQDLAELGLISIEEEGNGLPTSKKQTRKRATVDQRGVENSEAIQEEKFNFDDLPPITKSTAGSLKAPDDKKDYSHRADIPPIIKSMLGAFEAEDDFDYKEVLTKALVEKYL